jgi:hypothetical protein
MYCKAMAMMCNIPDKSVNLTHLQQLADAGLGNRAASDIAIHQIALNAIVDPKRLRIMLDEEVNLDPEIVSKILKKLTAHMEKQKQRD